jgi:hypothetical protein
MRAEGREYDELYEAAIAGATYYAIMATKRARRTETVIYVYSNTQEHQLARFNDYSEAGMRAEGRHCNSHLQ